MNKAWLVFAGAFQGFIGALVLWNVLDRMIKVNGVGLLAGKPWPINDVYAAIAAGTVLGALGGLILALRNRRLERKLADMAGQMDLTFREIVPREEWETYALSGRWTAVEREWKGDRPGWSFRVADVTEQTQGGGDQGPKSKTKTIAFLEFADTAGGEEVVPVPDLWITPRSWSSALMDWLGIGGIRFEESAVPDTIARKMVREFQQTFVVFPTEGARALEGKVAPKNPEMANPDLVDLQIRQCLTLSVMESLLRDPKISMQSQGGRLAFWEGNRCLDPKQRVDLLDRAIPLARAFLDAAQTLESNDPIPAPPETSRRQTPRILWTTVAGAVIGMFGGFFGGGLLFFFLIEKAIPAKDFLITAISFFGSIFGGAALGALTLGWIGNRIGRMKGAN